MTGGSREPLTKEAMGALLDRLTREAPRPECWSCKCLGGFIAQLELDTPDDAKGLPAKYKVPPKDIHSCLGCEPCPPAEAFAEYLMRKRSG